MLSFIKIILLSALFFSRLLAAELDQTKPSSFYSYIEPLLNPTSSAQQIITWLGERSGVIKPKSGIQKLAIKAATENKKKKTQIESPAIPVTIQASVLPKEAFFILGNLLKSWEWSWNIFYFDEYDEKSDVNADDELPTSSLKKTNQQNIVSNEASGPKINKRTFIGSTEKEVVPQAHLYGKKKRKPTKAANTIFYTSMIEELIDKIINAAIETSTQKEVLSSSGPTNLYTIKPTFTTQECLLDAIITESLYHPSATEIILKQIALITKYLDALEAANKRFPIFSQIALERENATKKCIELIEKTESLLNEEETSIPGGILLAAKHDFDTNKADFVKKKAEFESYIQVLLALYADTNRAKPNDYFATSMENICLYNSFLENKIILLENILNLVDIYL